jgi:hypothetical protein
VSNKNLSRRLEQLEAERAPDGDPEVLKITVSRIGKPDRIIELRQSALTGRGRRPWQRYGGRGR